MMIEAFGDFYRIHKKTIIATIGWLGLAVYYGSQGLTEQCLMALGSAATTAGLGPAWSVTFSKGRPSAGPPYMKPLSASDAAAGSTSSEQNRGCVDPSDPVPQREGI